MRRPPPKERRAAAGAGGDGVCVVARYVLREGPVPVRVGVLLGLEEHMGHLTVLDAGLFP